MATKISTITELFHRFHNCEMQLKQGKIAACLINFKEVIEKSPAIPKTEKEKSELHAGIEAFLKNLSAHKKFKEIFGEMSFGDTDLETNLEFIKSMIAAQEEDIVERVKKDEESSEAHRLEIDREKQQQQTEILKKIEQAVRFIDEENLPQALEIIGESEDIREAVLLHYNDMGMQCRTVQEFAQAIENYKKALIVAPDDEHLHYNMGRAHFEAGASDKAENFLANAMRLNPEFKEGKIFYDHLLKINHPQAGSARRQNIAFVFFQRIFHFRQRPKAASPADLTAPSPNDPMTLPPDDLMVTQGDTRSHEVTPPESGTAHGSAKPKETDPAASADLSGGFFKKFIHLGQRPKAKPPSAETKPRQTGAEKQHAAFGFVQKIFHPRRRSKVAPPSDLIT